MSAKPVELVLAEPASDWDAMVAEELHATVFHRNAWLEFIAGVAGATVQRWEIRRGARRIGLFPAFLLRRGPFRVVASPPPQTGAPYLGPLVGRDDLGESLRAFITASRCVGASYVELRLDPWIEPVPLAPLGFEGETRSTFLLDLRPGKEDLWTKSLSSGCRRAVRKAEKSGIEIEEGELRSIVDLYCRFAEGVFAKWNRPPPLGRKDYLALADLAERDGGVKVFLARHEGAIVAAGIFPFYNGCIYYFDGASDPGAHGVRPNNLLHWNVIHWATGAGLERYDMVGAGIAGVARFKRGFGPEETPYLYAYRPLSPWARVARSAYVLLAPVVESLRHRLSFRGRG